MNSLDLKKTAEDLIDTFLEAGKIAKEISHKGVEILIKPDNSPVTNGDLAVDKLLQTKIKSFNPNIPIISEETVNLKNKLFFNLTMEINVLMEDINQKIILPLLKVMNFYWNLIN